MEKASLPSSDSAARFLRGEPGSLPGVVLSTLGRAALIGGGLFLAGERKNLIKYSLAGALMIEVFVLWYVQKEQKEEV
jgi:hypothetical protein